MSMIINHELPIPEKLKSQFPLSQRIQEIKKKYPDKTIWLYTGYQWEDICELPVIPYLDVVVDGRFIEEIGTYDPTKDPSEFHVNEELAKKWLANGAQPTEVVGKIFKAAGIEK